MANGTRNSFGHGLVKVINSVGILLVAWPEIVF